MLAVHIEVLKIASFVTFIYALASTIILGIPLYYLLRKRVLLSPMVSILAGGLVALAATLLLVLSDEGTRSNMAETFGFVATSFICGLIAGLVFWLCAFWRGPAFMKSVRP